MKQNSLLIVSIIVFILIFINGWYSDNLFDFLWIGVLLIDITLFIGYCICVVLSIKKILSNHKKISNYLPAIILIFTAFIIIFFPFREIKAKVELSLYEKQRIEIIQMIKNKDLIVDENNNVILPQKYKMLSSGGEAVVYKNDEENTVIGFWVFRGMSSGSTLLIYSNKGEKIIKNNETGHPISTINHLTGNWYYVVTDY